MFFERYRHKHERESIQDLLKLPLGVLAEPENLWRVSHPSTIEAPMFLNFGVRMGTGVSYIANLLIVVDVLFKLTSVSYLA
jgi:hypothetical protein